MPSWDDYNPHYSSEWDDQFTNIVDDLIQHNQLIGRDDYALELVDRAFFDMDLSRGERDLARAEAAFYFDDNFDVDLFDVWDYDDYRDWYDAA